MTRNITRFFERKHRDNGEAFYCLTDNAPDWLTDAVREAHDDEFPNDWRYNICHSIISDLDDATAPTDDDDMHESADTLVDIYNSDRLTWLHDSLGRIAYCDEAQSDGLTAEPADVFGIIGAGQYVCILQMAYVLRDAYVEAMQDGSYQCDECSKIGTVDDLCEDGEPCPDEDCDGICHWTGE